jgi:hypothetical protein
MFQRYHLTSGRMLHEEGCSHFLEELPPREATPEELVSLPVCSSCLLRAGGRAPSATRPLGSISPERRAAMEARAIERAERLARGY